MNISGLLTVYRWTRAGWAYHSDIRYDYRPWGSLIAVIPPCGGYYIGHGYQVLVVLFYTMGLSGLVRGFGRWIVLSKRTASAVQGPTRSECGRWGMQDAIKLGSCCGIGGCSGSSNCLGTG